MATEHEARETQTLKIGDRLFEFNENRRVYERDASGHNRIVYRKHFLPHWIVGTEGRSWVVCSTPPGEREWGRQKVGFASVGRGKWHTEQQVEDRIWAREHRYTISRMVDAADVPLLRRIAEMVGYEAPLTQQET